jgi:two-component system, cell cycle response regulator
MEILVADDHPIFREVLRRMLTSWGFDVIVACDGDEAWNCLQSEGAPKLVVLDWMMPGVDGIELCRRIRGSERGGGVYIIMLTAKTDTADLLVAMEAGVDDYVTKPLNSIELRTRLRSAGRILEVRQQRESDNQPAEHLVPLGMLRTSSPEDRLPITCLPGEVIPARSRNL